MWDGFGKYPTQNSTVGFFCVFGRGIDLRNGPKTMDSTYNPKITQLVSLSPRGVTQMCSQPDPGTYPPGADDTGGSRGPDREKSRFSWWGNHQILHGFEGDSNLLTVQ